MDNTLGTARYMAALASLFLLSAPLYAQDDNSKSSSKEEGNHNVMLNASSANGPREIQIGLPLSRRQRLGERSARDLRHQPPQRQLGVAW